MAGVKAIKPQIAILVVLMLVMAVVYARSRHQAAARSGAVERDAAVRSPASAAAQDPGLDARRAAQRAEAAKMAWQRDPFSRGPARGHGDLALSGILWDADRPLAIINGEALQPGQEIDGFRVVSVEPARVLVTDGAETLELQLAP